MMDQWYKCPGCGKDLLYATNPCPNCKGSLAWQQQGPILAIDLNPESVNSEGDDTLKPTAFRPLVTNKSKAKSVLSTIVILLVILGIIFVIASYLNGRSSAPRPDIAPAPNQPASGIGERPSYLQQYTNVQPPYEKSTGGRIHLINNSDARDVSYSSLCNFIYEDKTDDDLYISDRRKCVDFAETVHNNAEQKGIKAAWVGIQFENQDVGHAINAFQTTDKGLVYIDCTGPARNQACFFNDHVAYVEKGKEYGTIEIEKADSLDYSFYIRYKQMWNEYQVKMEQYNNDVEAFNRALGGRTTLAEPEYSRFQAWKRRLEQQETVLDELGQNLGHCFSDTSMSIVKTVDIYW